MLPGVELTAKLDADFRSGMSACSARLVTGTYQWKFIAADFSFHLRFTQPAGFS